MSYIALDLSLKVVIKLNLADILRVHCIIPDAAGIRMWCTVSTMFTTK